MHILISWAEPAFTSSVDALLWLALAAANGCDGSSWFDDGE